MPPIPASPALRRDGQAVRPREPGELEPDPSHEGGLAVRRAEQHLERVRAKAAAHEDPERGERGQQARRRSRTGQLGTDGPAMVGVMP
jgi:hypothetical protein